VSATGQARAEDFALWEELAKSMHVSSLAHAIKDCRRAAEAMRGHNPEREGYYIDQALTFGQELIRRRNRAEVATGKTVELEDN
jgi:hypothetical protein